jgi:hypothetical protein
MTEPAKPNKKWLWVIVRNSGAEEAFMGLHDEAQQESFIPAFRDREEARSAMAGLRFDDSASLLEIQAIEEDNLARQASESGFQVCVLDGAGRIVDHVGR